MPRTSDARERMIISAALLQRERGVPGTGLPEVLKHSGAPRGSIYHHFPGGRAQVAEEATVWAADFMGRQIDTLAEEETPVNAIDRFADVWIAILTESDFAAGCPVAAAALDYTEESAARRAAADGFARWRATIQTALQRAGTDEDDARDLATMAISAFEGAIVLARANRDTEPVRVAARYLRVLISQSAD